MIFVLHMYVGGLLHLNAAWPLVCTKYESGSALSLYWLHHNKIDFILNALATLISDLVVFMFFDSDITIRY